MSIIYLGKKAYENQEILSVFRVGRINLETYSYLLNANSLHKIFLKDPRSSYICYCILRDYLRNYKKDLYLWLKDNKIGYGGDYEADPDSRTIGINLLLVPKSQEELLFRLTWAVSPGK